jgi:predicted TPR repeat methyltransferase
LSVAGQCLVCEGSSTEAIFGGLLRCKRCAHAFAPPEATDQDLAALYTESYFAGEEYQDYLSDRKVTQRNFLSRLLVLDTFISPQRHRSLFEVGSAYGFFLDVARHRFDSVQGIDVSAAGVRYARDCLGLDVVCADLLNYDLAVRKFDVVCMWDTIEHLSRPDLYIAKLAEHMDSGALLAITTGDFGSLNAQMRRTKWRLMHPPTHAHYFSLASIGTLLERFGFELVYRRHCGFYRSLKSMAYGVFDQRHGRPLVGDLIQRLGIGEWPIYLNLFDIMYVVARKR